MHVADVARVAAVAAAKVFDRAFEHEDSRTGASRRNRGAKSCISAADD
jgi:hypothetical protein